ncbi:aldose epimerase family protein [Thalassotalea profundi]|uniref:Aldose 1-epimerase n=1 Tax=Thalassotalea profundi TaxID=2036687 RepID=A0ABQ3J513_9GAMM|nr:aldose epimerase family protein [Thalassotalea profundi]GHE99476.1 aldose 1-epimerase [Thalassotalea profundi]
MNSKPLTEHKKIHQKSFGHLSNGENAQLFILKNSHGTEVSITNFGAIITGLSIADANGNFDDIVLGYENVTDYENDTYYLGAIIGRYAGRIKNGEIIVNNHKYQLTLNAGNSQLHGGNKGLNKQLWRAHYNTNDTSVTLVLAYTSPDGEEGFPGTVDFKVHYTLTEENELIVEYFASADQTTIINLTQHSYFNLAGHDNGNIEDHYLTMNAQYYLPMNNEAYPTGEIKAVQGGIHDFRQSKRIGKDISSKDPQIIIGKGYDNYWLLNELDSSQQSYSAQVEERKSGRRMTVVTDQPSLILYTANYIDGSHIGKNNTCYQQRAALCLEPVRAVTKNYINDFTPTMLYPDKPFYGKTVYRFDTIAKKLD